MYNEVVVMLVLQQRIYWINCSVQKQDNDWIVMLMVYYVDVNNTVMKSTVTKPVMTQKYINGVIYEKGIYNFMCN